jgi:hypothetical protein
VQDKRSREIQDILDGAMTLYHIKLIEDECGQQHILPGALLEVVTRDGETRPAFFPFLDRLYQLGDHTVVHVNREEPDRLPDD